MGGLGECVLHEEIVRNLKAARRRRALADHGVEEVSCEK
jgi:hypothetical protein